MVKTDREIYEELRGDLVRFAAVLVGPDEASDVVSTVVTRTLSGKGSLTALEEPKQYLMKAVVNEGRSFGRRAARSSPLASVEEHDVPQPDIAEGAYPDVTRAVMDLPAKQRAAVYLVYWMGLSGAEASRILGARPATVRRYLSLAREKLKAQFDE